MTIYCKNFSERINTPCGRYAEIFSVNHGAVKYERLALARSVSRREGGG